MVGRMIKVNVIVVVATATFEVTQNIFQGRSLFWKHIKLCCFSYTTSNGSLGILKKKTINICQSANLVSPARTARLATLTTRTCRERLEMCVQVYRIPCVCVCVCVSVCVPAGNRMRVHYFFNIKLIFTLVEVNLDIHNVCVFYWVLEVKYINKKHFVIFQTNWHTSLKKAGSNINSE